MNKTEGLGASSKNMQIGTASSISPKNKQADSLICSESEFGNTNRNVIDNQNII